MSRTLKTDISGPDWRVSFDKLERCGPSDLFGVETRPRLVLDVGFGRGEFLTALAEKDAGVAFLGIEYSRKRVLKMARRLALTELRNVRLVEAPAEAVLDRAIAAASVHRCWINFPDPWPKKRHHKRRVIQDRTIKEFYRVLQPRGEVRIVTDHDDLWDWCEEHAARHDGLFSRGSFSGRDDELVGTNFERKYSQEGRAFHAMTLTRIDA